MTIIRSDYEAAHEAAALLPRWDRRFLRVTGKAPGDMLNGVLSGRLPGSMVPVRAEGATHRILKGEVTYSTLLTPKGRMLTDLRLFSGLEEGFFLDLPEAGTLAALEHFRKFLPPRLARVEETGEEWALFSLMGPTSVVLMLETLLGGEAEGEGASELGDLIRGLEEGEELVLPESSLGPIRIAANGDVSTQAWDFLVGKDREDEARVRLVEGGVQALVPATYDVLRVERGRPAFGKDMTTETIPVEAGIQDRAIDYGKGCYTGQEVVIRLRDRGQVNKRMVGILLGEASPPPSGTELFVADREKAVGWITSAVTSPAFGETAALGYLKRGFEAGTQVLAGGPHGPSGKIVALTDEGWKTG
jgi:aminomethyltransferase